MNEQQAPGAASESGRGESRPQPIVIRQPPPPASRRWLTRLLLIALIFSVLFNFGVISQYHEYFANVTPPRERYHSGDRDADAKIAIVEVSGTVMPPFTERILAAVDRATDDDAVKAAVVLVDSPGGLVADSHQIYHRLKKLSEKKPVMVAMQRMAASGGYYIAMGAGKEGKIYAEPTTWTGSIGVLIPRYDVSELAEKAGIEPDSLTSGEFKDALNPLRELTEREREVWMGILDDAFDRFVEVIVENRPNLDHESVTQLATGEVFTASQAKSNGLIDEIGYLEDVTDELQKQLKIPKVRIVTYDIEPTLMELLTSSADAGRPENHWRALLESTVPRALYYCSWAPGIPVWRDGIRLP